MPSGLRERHLLGLATCGLDGGGRGLAVFGGLWRLVLQHPADRGGPRAGPRLVPAVSRPRCSRIARTPRACFTYASTRCLALNPVQANTSTLNARCATRPGPLAVSSASSAPCWPLPQAPCSPPARLLEGAEMTAVWRLERRRHGLLRGLSEAEVKLLSVSPVPACLRPARWRGAPPPVGRR